VIVRLDNHTEQRCFSLARVFQTAQSIHSEGTTMTREEAIETIYKIINSGIIDMELEEDLTEVAVCIEDDSFDEDENEEDE
jgi:20S proteasome alpha/beta subunit